MRQIVRGITAKRIGILKRSLPGSQHSGIMEFGGIKFDEEQWNDMKNVEQLADV